MALSLVGFCTYLLAALASGCLGAVVPHPMITTAPSVVDLASTKVQGRDIVSDLDGLGSYLSGVIGTFPSYIASGVPNFFQGFPTGTAVQSSLGISDSDLAATPTQALNIPYALSLGGMGYLLADRFTAAMQTGQRMVGIFDFMATSTNSLIYPSQNSMSWPMSS
jgi:hypothetical protein